MKNRFLKVCRELFAVSICLIISFLVIYLIGFLSLVLWPQYRFMAFVLLTFLYGFFVLPNMVMFLFENLVNAKFLEQLK